MPMKRARMTKNAGTAKKPRLYTSPFFTRLVTISRGSFLLFLLFIFLLRSLGVRARFFLFFLIPLLSALAFLFSGFLLLARADNKRRIILQSARFFASLSLSPPFTRATDFTIRDAAAARAVAGERYSSARECIENCKFTGPPRYRFACVYKKHGLSRARRVQLYATLRRGNASFARNETLLRGRKIEMDVVASWFMAVCF